jgi:hypothetical protein
LINPVKFKTILIILLGQMMVRKVERFLVALLTGNEAAVSNPQQDKDAQR